MPITLSELSEFSSEAQGTWGIYTLKPEGPWLSMLVPWIFCSTILESMVYCSGQKTSQVQRCAYWQGGVSGINESSDGQECQQYLLHHLANPVDHSAPSSWP